MARDIKINIQYPGKKVKFDYCKPVVDWIVDGKESTSKKKEVLDALFDQKRIIKACAPTQIELKEYAEDIIQYYKSNFATSDLPYDFGLEITIVADKAFQNGDIARFDGKRVEISYWSILNGMLHSWKRYDDYKEKGCTREKYCVSQDYDSWKYDTKNVFQFQIRHTLAHEIYHVIQDYEFSKAGARNIWNNEHVLPEILATYFAICYINELSNLIAGGVNLCAISTFTGQLIEEKKIGGFFRDNAKEFVKVDSNEGLQASDYNGGDLLAALAIKDGCGNFGQYYFYKELYKYFLNGEPKKAIQELIDRKGEI